MTGIRRWCVSHRSDLLCLVALVGFATLFMHRWLRPGYVPVPLNLESAYLPWHGQVFEPPQNLLISDMFHIFYPGRLYLTESLRQGSLPLWNPYIFSGHPLLGDTNIPNYYPPNLLAALILDPAQALPVLAWLHVILSGTLMYLFLRTLTLRPGVALLGSIPWMLSEFTVVWLESPDKLSTMAWMPGMFACFEMAVQRQRVRWVMLGGFAFGLEILGGQTQIALYSAILLGLYALCHAAQRSWRDRRLDIWPLVALILVGGVGIGVGAAQLFPTWQFVPLSDRGEMALDKLLSTRWPLHHIVTLWLPDFFGNALRYDYRSVFNFVETAAYFGVVPALLCVMSPFVNRHYVIWPMVGLFVWIVLVAGGTWLVRWIAWLPGLRYFTLSRWAGLLAFPGAVLAACAVDELLRRRQIKQMAAVLGMALVLTIMIVGPVFLAHLKDVTQHWSIIRADLVRTSAIVGMAAAALWVMIRWPHLGLIGLVILTFADLYQWGEPFNPVHPARLLYPQNQVVEVLRQDSTVYRVLPIRANRTVFGPGVLLVFRIPEIGGSTSLAVKRYLELLGTIDPDAQLGGMVTARHFRTLYSLLNVKYVLSPRELPNIVAIVQYEGCQQQTPPLTGDSFFEQGFVSDQTGLNRVDVAFANVGDVGDQPVRFRLWRGSVGGELLADITTSVADLSDREASAFFFAPVPDSLGDRFVWRVEAPGARPNATVAVCLADHAPERTASFTAYGVQLQQVDFRQGVWIYQNPNVLPRAYIVHHAQIVSGKRALEVIGSPQFNPFRTATLETPLPDNQSASLSLQPIRSAAQATITRYEAHRVDVQAQTPLPGLLVLSDVYYPGWQVWVDGQPSQLLLVNHALRGVYLPAGSHAISFIFRPSVFYIGLATTGLTVIVAVLIMVADYTRKLTGSSWLRSKRQLH